MTRTSDHRQATDVCIIGSGVAGGIVAAECVAAGLEVVMVEAGRAWSTRRADVRFIERLIGSHRFRMRLWLRRARYNSVHHRSAGGRKYALPGAALVVRGGTTLVWSGFAYRMQPEDFRLRDLTGIGVDWPISYDDLERHYRRAEQTLRVRGDHTDPGHPPRTGPFPVTPPPFDDRDQLFIDVLGRDSVMHHNAAVSPDGGPFAADEILDQLERQQRFTLLSGRVASRLVVEGSRRCVAVEGRTCRGRTVLIEADTFVLCAGGIESPKLLVASRTSSHPDGLGNHGGHVGHNLVSHTGVTVGGTLGSTRAAADSSMPTAASRAYDTEREQAEGKYLVLWRPYPRMGMALNAVVEQHPQWVNRVELAAGVDGFGLPRTVVHFNHDESHVRRVATVAGRLRTAAGHAGMDLRIDHDYVHAHPMCTTRMSDDPADGVVDRNLRVHGVDNLFVCGSSSFTTGAAAHPTMTVAALAHRLGEHLTGGRTRA